MTSLDACKIAFADVQKVVGRVSPADLDRPTPCSAWNARALINHMVSTLDELEKPARGEQMSFNAQEANDVIGSDPAGAFAKKTSEFIAAWSVPGATERVVTTGFGEQPASFYLTLAMGDILVHGWDLASAIGAPYAMNEELAASLLGGMRNMLKPEMRGPDKAFDAEVPVPANASVQDQLLAFSGRTPR